MVKTTIMNNVIVVTNGNFHTIGSNLPMKIIGMKAIVNKFCESAPFISK